MKSLPLLPCCSALLLVLGALSSANAEGTAHRAEALPPAAGMVPKPTSSSGGAPSECPDGFFPDDDVCVSFPDFDGELPLLEPEENIHRERTGRWAIYEQIPRRPERPESYDRYRYPVPPGILGNHYVVSGYDLDLADERQRRGHKLRAVGHGGLDLPNPRGTPVRLLHLEHEQGESEVVFVGHLFGTTVITKHTVREAGRLRDYILLYGHLDRAEPTLKARSVLHEGDVLGYVGDSDSPTLVHLHLEARRVRESVDIFSAPAYRLLDVTVVCDPRNVLPLADL